MKTFDQYIFQANGSILNYDYKAFEHSFLHKLLEGQALTSLIDEIIYIRTEAFELQSFARVLRRCGEIKYEVLGDQLREDAKFCEDSFGKFLYSYEMFDELSSADVKLNEQSISDLLVAYFKLMEQVPLIISKQKDIKVMLAQLPENHLQLKKLYLKGLKKELKNINKNIKNIDANLLEDGTHKLRRLIRWVIMHIIYPQGLFGYKDQPESGPSPFLQLQPQAINEPVQLTYAHLHTLSSMVGLLGGHKDDLLFHHYENELKNKSFDINESNQKVVALTQNILDEIKNKKILKSIRKEL